MLKQVLVMVAISILLIDLYKYFIKFLNNSEII